MRRREFIALVGGAAAGWPIASRAQQPADHVRRIGVLQPVANDPEGQARVTAWQARLQELGWTNGGNIRVDYRWVTGGVDQIRAAAAELLALKPDVVLASSTPAVAALREQTHTIPIVFVQVVDPVAAGF